MQKAGVFSLILTIAATVCLAQTEVAIRGSVTDANGDGLSGAIVRLANAALETETDQYGNYVLGNGAANPTLPVYANQGAFAEPVLKAGKVLFSVTGADVSAKINVYDLHGRFVNEVFRGRMNEGNYSVALDMRRLTSQSYVLSVNLDGITHAIKFSAAGSRALSSSNGMAEGAHASLKKAVALDDTIKVTKPGYSIGVKSADVSAGVYDFKLTRTSTWNGDVEAFWGDTSSYPKGKTTVTYVFLNRTNGKFRDDQIFWSDQMSGKKISLAEQRTFNPTNNGRCYVWVAPNDSSNRYYDFVEQNINGRSWYGNTTRVDGWRLPLTIRLHCDDGYDIVLGDDYTMFYQSRESKFAEFRNEVPREFMGLGSIDPYAIWAPHVSPVNFFNKGGLFENYFEAYQDSVRLVHPDAPAKVSAWNIFACAGGGIGSSPAYSSAVNRHCATLPQTEWTKAENFYNGAPCNYYSKFFHRRAINEKCYGFPYDDYGDQAAYTGHGNCQWLLIAIGY
jgi:hypothetical protein